MDKDRIEGVAVVEEEEECPARAANVRERALHVVDVAGLACLCYHLCATLRAVQPSQVEPSPPLTPALPGASSSSL